jgi:hypothetical protein
MDGLRVSKVLLIIEYAESGSPERENTAVSDHAV